MMSPNRVGQMLKHLKLTTIRWIFALLMLTICLILGGGALYLEHKITLIDNTWVLFQTDRSEKARQESEPAGSHRLRRHDP